jgi:hypothetical protein
VKSVFVEIVEIPVLGFFKISKFFLNRKRVEKTYVRYVKFGENPERIKSDKIKI